MYKHAALLCLLLCSVGCEADEDNAEQPTEDANPLDAHAEEDEGTPALPSTFGDCAEAPCEVALEAFTANQGAIPYCAPTLDLEALRASEACAGFALERSEHEGRTLIRASYGPAGDGFDCLYDEGDALVGARWFPDNHPTQIAGEGAPGGGAFTPLECVE